MRSFQDEERALNCTTLCWPQQLGPIFDQNERVNLTSHCFFTFFLISSPLSHSQILEESQHRGERELTERQEKAQIEIEKCRQRVDELAEYNDLNLITQYCKEVTQLQKKLNEIQDQITQINKVRECPFTSVN